MIGQSLCDEKRGDLTQAARRLDAALRDRPESLRLVLARAGVEERRGDWRRALEIVRAALAKEPRSAGLLNFVGFVSADHGGDVPAALTFTQAALALDPAAAGIMDSVGWACFRLGDDARASLFLEQAARLEPGDPEILAHVADLSAHKGDPKRAGELYRRALADKPDARLRKDIEARLRAIETRSPAER